MSENKWAAQALWLSLVFLPQVGRKTSACVSFRVEQTCGRGQLDQRPHHVIPLVT